jgi:hypothetical protein
MAGKSLMRQQEYGAEPVKTAIRLAAAPVNRSCLTAVSGRQVNPVSTCWTH